MAEVGRYLFTHKEVVTALIKEQDLHEGIWSLVIEFGLGAANAGPNDEELSPTAMVAVQKIGLHKVDKITNLSVDATLVNPSAITADSGRSTRKKKTDI
jgi:hypothetical protein